MKLTNDYKQLRSDWYSWTIRVDGTEEELDQIDHVVYTLHESFSNRRLVSQSSSDHYARTVKGWGEFLLKAEAIMKDGSSRKAELWLNLGFPNTAAEKEKWTGKFK